MSVDWTGISGLAVSLATAGGAIYTARAGRRTRGQELRDDFSTITGRLDKEVRRLQHRADEQEADAGVLRGRIATQDHTILYLVSWVRLLVAEVRRGGQESPPIPEPIPDDVKPYLHDIGI